MSEPQAGLEGAFARLARPLSDLFLPEPQPGAASAGERWLLLALLLIAAAIRLWGVGSFSLHKPDEDTTVLAAAHILVDGRPVFPSGMFYARAIAQSYLIAGSAVLFGSTEFAYRLPSVLCGVLLIWTVWLASLRFLGPLWRIALVAAVVFLPAAIADSQEARMYCFFVTSLTGFLVLVFRWERTGRLRDLVAAVLVMLVALQFQELALFGALAVLFPGLVRADGKRLTQGMIALVVMGLGYLAISHWQGSYYPELAQDYLPTYTDPLRTPPPLPVARLQWSLLLGALGGALMIGLIVARQLRSNVGSALLAAGIAVALILQAVYAYHLAGLVWLFVVVVAARSRRVPAWAWVLCAGLVVGLAAFQLLQLQGAGLGLRKAAGQLAGRPSIWAYLQLAMTSPGAAAVSALGLAGALFALARGRRISDLWLLFALTVWVPLLAIGVFAWFLPPRYVQFAMVPLLITAFGVASRVDWRRIVPAIPAMAIVLVIVGPVSAVRAINAGASFPNHKAAATFLKSRLGPQDVVIAEECLIHSFYLGHVDYWLASPEVAAPFVVRKNGVLRDQYADAELIDSVAKLQAVGASAHGGRVYLIGSVEGGDRLYFRGPELNALLQSGRLPEVYRGEDGTRIWDVTGGIASR